MNDEITRISCPPGTKRDIGGLTCDVVAKVKTDSYGYVDLVDIPQMSDERWKEIADEQKGKCMREQPQRSG